MREAADAADTAGALDAAAVVVVAGATATEYVVVPIGIRLVVVRAGQYETVAGQAVMTMWEVE